MRELEPLDQEDMLRNGQEKWLRHTVVLVYRVHPGEVRAVDPIREIICYSSYTSLKLVT